MLNLVNNSTKETFRLPQSVHEIGFDYVSSCVEHIELRKHYALIALITTAPLVDLIDTNNKSLANTKAVLIKANYADENDNDKTPVNRFILLLLVICLTVLIVILVRTNCLLVIFVSLLIVIRISL